jgi:hypothetical protein
MFLKICVVNTCLREDPNHSLFTACLGGPLVSRAAVYGSNLYDKAIQSNGNESYPQNIALVGTLSKAS